MSRQYTVYVIPTAWKEIQRLPGNVRQRVKRAIDILSRNPRPSKSKSLNTASISTVENELRRLRIDN